MSVLSSVTSDNKGHNEKLYIFQYSDDDKSFLGEDEDEE